MSDWPRQIPIYKKQPVQVQIRNQVRRLILSGQLAPATRIPPAQELARAWQTSTATIHGALAPLEKEGLIARSPRIGTFVRHREEKLTQAGIYYLPRLGAKRSPYELSLRNQLEHRLTERGVSISHWIDPRSREKTDAAWPELIEAARTKKIQALIIPGAGPEQLKWLAKLPVPTAFLSSAGLPNGVGNDPRELLELSLRELKQQGCRSVGVISPVHYDERSAHLGMDGTYRYLEALHETTAQLGLELRNDWARRAATHVMDEQPQMQFGYEEFRLLWALPVRPAGLLAHPDSVAKGVIAAVLEQGVRVPADLKLVLAKNQHVDLFCPFPVTFVVQDEAEVAGALIEQVEKQFRGENCKAIVVGYTLSPAEDAGKP